VGIQNRSIWLRTKDRIMRIDQDGNTLQSISLRPNFKDGQIVAF